MTYMVCRSDEPGENFDLYKQTRTHLDLITQKVVRQYSPKLFLQFELDDS